MEPKGYSRRMGWGWGLSYQYKWDIMTQSPRLLHMWHEDRDVYREKPERPDTPQREKMHPGP